MKQCVGEKTYNCENCPALFNREDHLKVHINKKSCSIQCNLCDKTLKSAGFMERHIASVHRVQMNVVKTVEGHIGLFQSNELQKDLHCTRCDFVAISASKLKRHMIKHNPKPIKVEEKCPKCDMTFKYKSDLNRHILTSHRNYVKGNSRANQYRKMKKLDVAKTHLFET